MALGYQRLIRSKMAAAAPAQLVAVWIEGFGQQMAAPRQVGDAGWNGHPWNDSIWLVVTGTWLDFFSIYIYWESSSQVTNSYFSKGLKPPTSDDMAGECVFPQSYPSPSIPIYNSWQI
jgi:hypothetical protein